MIQNRTEILFVHQNQRITFKPVLENWNELVVAQCGKIFIIEFSSIGMLYHVKNLLEFKFIDTNNRLAWSSFNE